jgi:hypothetical protein
MTQITVAYGEAKRGWTSKIERVLKCEPTVTGVLFVSITLSYLLSFKHILAVLWKFRILSLFKFLQLLAMVYTIILSSVWRKDA